MANELNFLVDMNLAEKEIEIEAKIRYRSKPAKATLKIENNIAKVKFIEPQRAITPGQSVVFYLNDIVLGGGKNIIKENYIFEALCERDLRIYIESYNGHFVPF